MQGWRARESQDIVSETNELENSPNIFPQAHFLEEYRSGHNGAASKADGGNPREFESRLLRS